jgi:hypothetical protein
MERHVSSRLAAKAADDMLSPLIPDDDESEEDSDVESVERFKLDTIKPTPMQVLKSLIGKHIITEGGLIVLKSSLPSLTIDMIQQFTLSYQLESLRRWLRWCIHR